MGAIWQLDTHLTWNQILPYLLVGAGFLYGVLAISLPDLVHAFSEATALKTKAVLVIAMLGLLVISYFITWFCWRSLEFHSQRLHLVLRRDGFLVVQRMFVGWRQHHQVYTKANLTAAVVNPIPPSLGREFTRPQQQALYLQERDTPRNQLSWGYYLSEEQLTYIATLLRQLYIEDNANEWLLPKEEGEDWGPHLIDE